MGTWLLEVYGHSPYIVSYGVFLSRWPRPAKRTEYVRVERWSNIKSPRSQEATLQGSLVMLYIDVVHREWCVLDSPFIYLVISSISASASVQSEARVRQLRTWMTMKERKGCRFATDLRWGLMIWSFRNCFDTILFCRHEGRTSWYHHSEQW